MKRVIHYKDESMILNNAEDVNKIYIQNILPGKAGQFRLLKILVFYMILKLCLRQQE